MHHLPAAVLLFTQWAFSHYHSQHLVIYAQIQSLSDRISFAAQGNEKDPEEACTRHTMQAWEFEDPQEAWHKKCRRDQDGKHKSTEGSS